MVKGTFVADSEKIMSNLLRDMPSRSASASTTTRLDGVDDQLIAFHCSQLKHHCTLRNIPRLTVFRPADGSVAVRNARNDITGCRDAVEMFNEWRDACKVQRDLYRLSAATSRSQHHVYYFQLRSHALYRIKLHDEFAQK